MSDESTKLNYEASEHMSGGAGALRVTWTVGKNRTRTATFMRAFRIGRSRECEVAVPDPLISREHTEVMPVGNNWYVRDLDSRHGTYIDGARINQAPLLNDAKLQFRLGGPVVVVELERRQAESMTQIAEHYFAQPSGNIEGERTRMIRQAFARATQRQAKRYWVVLALVCAVLLGSLGVVLYQRNKLARTRELAVDIFYTMHETRLQIADIEQLIDDSEQHQHSGAVSDKKNRLQRMEEQYDKLLDQIGPNRQSLSPQERHIYRMARVFGECELNMPRDFVKEVHKYIGKWRTTSRLKRAIARAHEKNLPAIVYHEMLKHDLPPQYMYLALQESNFDERAIGPKTRFGIAKGMWQFIPDTALRYDLHTGPLVELRRYDPKDQRFDEVASTRAAAAYLRDIYKGDAQASGLLVLASYNWGPNNIRRRIRTMPANPRERNFWKLLEQHDIPQQTYDFVFYIFSAAVIGEEPALFGFDFAAPFANLDDAALHVQSD